MPKVREQWCAMTAADTLRRVALDLAANAHAFGDADLAATAMRVVNHAECMLEHGAGCGRDGCTACRSGPAAVRAS